MQLNLKGTGVALITPFHKDGNIDFKSFKKLINRCIEGKVEYLVPLGTTAESPTLTPDEKMAVLDFVVEVADKQVPVVLGLGGNSTREIIHKMENVNFENVSAILSVCPYYNKPSQKGIYQHYKLIASVSPVPVILYNVPGRTGVNMRADTTLSLANDVKNIVAIKEASGNFEQIMSIIKNKPKDFTVISGDDSITLPLISLGVEGVISVIANAYPKDFSEMVRQAMEGNFDKAKKIHFKLFDIMTALFSEGSPAGIKAALEILHVCSEHLRLPLVNVSRSTYNKLEGLMKG